MIAQLSGILVLADAMDVVIDCGGVGYAVSVPISTTDIMPGVGERVTLHTVMHVREDAMQLFGFATTAEREAFKLLTSITGIGGRTALGILSAMPLADLRQYLVSGNLVALQRLPGVGRKTAERMVVELREKIIGVVPEASASAMPAMSAVADEAVAALVALGYARAVAEKSVKAVIQAEPSVAASSEDLLRRALRMATAP
ncbi:MAG: Holliday junction branch migration protein RuvA [Candidatus Kapabacteria bacterium]|nr:Holliday junction branch migration protein RuvA [Candidatus Kapabacteria bacterium]